MAWERVTATVIASQALQEFEASAECVLLGKDGPNGTVSCCSLHLDCFMPHFFAVESFTLGHDSLSTLLAKQKGERAVWEGSSILLFREYATTVSPIVDVLSR